MSNRVWHSGPPPHVGWWNASIENANDSWRWWDGKKWSCAAFDVELAASACLQCEYIPPETTQKNVKWTDYWPKNARVPRIDPREQT